MNLVIASPGWLIALLVLLLIMAAVEDAARLRISNLTCALVLVGALIAIGLHGLSLSLWQNAAIFIAVLVIGTPAFALGLFGGGDVKLLAAIGLWLDLNSALYLFVAVVIAGGLLGLVYIIARKLALVSAAAGKRHGKVPYGLAIVAGALFVFGTQLSSHTSDPVLARLGVTPPSGR